MPIMDCNCEKCCSACTNKPGWFLPGEAERVAEFLGIDLKELFDEKLVVDYYFRGTDKETFVLAPAITDIKPGGLMPMNPLGQCVFYKDGQCSIHDVKPSECKEYIHSDTRDAIEARHINAADTWKDHQGQIWSLYGSIPDPKEDFTVFDVLDFMKSML